MGDMAWHGGGARRGRQQKLRRGPRPRLLALGLRAWRESKKHATHLDGGCTRHNNMTQLAPWRARSSKK